MMMSESPQENPQKSISEQLAEVMASLSVDQLRYVAAMQQCASKKEAAEIIGIEPNTVYKWPAVVEDAVRLTALDREGAAREIAKKNLVKAMMVKTKALDSDDEVLRQKVATEIIEWNLGKALQPIGGKDGGPIQTEDVTATTDTERLERLVALSNAARARRDGSAPSGDSGDASR